MVGVMWTRVQPLSLAATKVYNKTVADGGSLIEQERKSWWPLVTFTKESREGAERRRQRVKRGSGEEKADPGYCALWGDNIDTGMRKGAV